MGLIRLVVFGFLAMSVLYLAISVYSRSVRREKLEDEWAETHPDEAESPARETFITDGMAEYNRGLRPKLIALVYVVPTVLVIGILIATNWN
jgi:hypothetical protein